MITPAPEPVRVLLVADDEDDYLVTREMLVQPPGDVHRAHPGAAARTGALRRGLAL
ncbi:MAG: hypothetical protein ACR2NR_14080 [Solirubrobacteraceae bacterium]